MWMCMAYLRVTSVELLNQIYAEPNSQLLVRCIMLVGIMQKGEKLTDEIAIPIAVFIWLLDSTLIQIFVKWKRLGTLWFAMIVVLVKLMDWHVNLNFNAFVIVVPWLELWLEVSIELGMLVYMC